MSQVKTQLWCDKASFLQYFMFLFIPNVTKRNIFSNTILYGCFAQIQEVHTVYMFKCKHGCWDKFLIRFNECFSLPCCTYCFPCKNVSWIRIEFIVLVLIYLLFCCTLQFSNITAEISRSIVNKNVVVLSRCCCGRLVRQHVGFTASLASKYSDMKLGENPSLSTSVAEEWSVEKHTEASPCDAYGVINFQGGSHSYRAKVGGQILLC